MVKDRCIKGTGCGYCSAQTSRPEIRILTELSTVFGLLSPRQRVGKTWVDVLIEDIKLAIEYDGEFYHKSRRQQDYEKNYNLNSKGYEVIRFREGKLESIGQNDINVPVNKLGKEHIDLLLRKIKSSVPPRYEKSIEKYLKANSYQNESYFNDLVEAMPGAVKEQSLGYLYPDLLPSWDVEKINPCRLSVCSLSRLRNCGGLVSWDIVGRHLLEEELLAMVAHFAGARTLQRRITC